MISASLIKDPGCYSLQLRRLQLSSCLQPCVAACSQRRGVLAGVGGGVRGGVLALFATCLPKLAVVWDCCKVLFGA